MKITLGQPEIEAAIKQHIGPTGWGIPLEGKEVSIEMKAGRGDNRFSAEVNLKDLPKPTGATEAVEEADEDDQAINFDFEAEG